MKRKKKSSFKKKAVASLTALMISGLIPAGVALAQGELKAELVAEQGTIISGKPGETIMVPIMISVIPFGTNETSAVTVTANFDGKPSKTVSFKANELNVKKQVTLEYTIPITASGTVTPRVNMTSTDESGNDKVVDEKADNVNINIIQAPADTTAPIITLENPLSGFYNAITLPNRFAFTLDEASEVFVNGESKGALQTGRQELDLPVASQGNNTVTVSAKDAAGNESEPVRFTYFYDSINPLVTASADKDLNEYGWYNSDVQVSFKASDVNGSGVASVDEPVTISAEGADQIITGSATDKAGNVGTGSISLNIDKTAPTISGSTDRNANSNGWYNTDVTVKFTADDSLSGIASYTNPVTLDEGESQSVEGIAVDKAGNSKSTTVSGINIDKTAPTISGSTDRNANSNGWYNTDVTVKFTADDSLSGIASYTNPVTLVEGKDQSVEGIAFDKAGNSKSTTVYGINIDKTAPTISGSTDRNANSNGWYNTDVTVKFTADDSLSGIASYTNPVTLVEGKDQSVEGIAFDKAGNSKSTTVYGINIDKTAPTISGSTDRNANSNGWYNTDVTVKFTADDSLSGIASYTNPVTLGEGESQSVEGIAFDKAGNSKSTTVSGINIDKTAPTISGSVDRQANENGWYNNDVTVTFRADDSLSGIASYTKPVTLGEGKAQSVEGNAFDKAGNSKSTAVSGINIDKTTPEILGVEDGATFTLNQVVNWTASDSLSGLVTEESGTIDTSKIGTFTVKATDRAGNTVVKTYTIVYNYSGILQPINQNGSSIFKAGSTVPVKFQLRDAQGGFVSSAIATISFKKVGAEAQGNVIEAVSTSAATTGNLFRYNATSNQYIFNLSTKGYEKGQYNITITLNDGKSYTVEIGLK
ncbi:hypothetical protein A8F94_08750 [Bacillus sp. FJAT-27225]|uniref:PxKF domain-containing protein n=1 Tax=Bacillus sp. FJAT-27225 TaxID=1743144 RepID=UPI00080C255D|nr:PxKF domain-containing protein [Bacillus sp. FJAT-27225]OCA87910.1 hypothetical protein A8F94_08750 [Bacillus sp. FJAT-27225]